MARPLKGAMSWPIDVSKDLAQAVHTGEWLWRVLPIEPSAIVLGPAE